MLVYGDRSRAADSGQTLADLRVRLETLEAQGPPIERHARLCGVFIAAGELTQGLADAVMAVQGQDGPSPEQAAAMALLMELAHALLASWRALGEGTTPPALDRVALGQAFAGLETLTLPAEVQLKAGEGYAFYALYPEGYAEAAAQLSDVKDGAASELTVIGIRSIGVGLAAIAAAALGSSPPVTVRPIGHPFARELRLGPELEGVLKTRTKGGFVVVDEGPGLSGSSLGAVADALEALGAGSSGIAFLPSHSGDLGAEASPRHRLRWASAERPCREFDARLLQAERPGHSLASWFSDLTGGSAVSLQDLSGGGWRALRYADEADWPSANTYQERRKFLLACPNGTWLLKFVGLGDAGERAFAQAQALAAAGFAPEVTALRYGFLAQPWLASSRPLRLDPTDRPAFAGHLGGYLGWRAARLPAPPDSGATLDALLEMARINLAEACGPGVLASRALDPARWSAAPPTRRVWTDNRLHLQEWLQLEDGGWLKADGVDHAAAHDLVGAQDIAWDVAAARVEFDLDEDEMAILAAALRREADLDAGLVAILEPAYVAFQLGAFSLAADAHSGWPQEQGRLQQAAESYRARLACLLA